MAAQKKPASKKKKGALAATFPKLSVSKDA
jgi:hypothetical protein